MISPPEIGTPALLDAITVTKPDVEDSIETSLSGSSPVAVGDNFEYTLKVSNHGRYALNGTQAFLTLPDGVQYVSASGGYTTLAGPNVIVTLGRLAPKDTFTVTVTVKVISKGHLHARAEIRSGTALPVGVESKDTGEGNGN